MREVAQMNVSSSDNHATKLPQTCSGGQCLGPEIHSLTNMVLPKPAGAEMRVNLRSEENPLFKRSISQGWRTRLARGGINSFVRRRATDIQK